MNGYRPSGVMFHPVKKVEPAARTLTQLDPVDSALVRAGQSAWNRVRNSAALSFKDWQAIGRAIRVGRRVCMKATNSKKPQGRRYSDAMSVWLKERGLDEIGEPTRCEALRMVEDLAISECRDTLPEHERVRLNHPRSVLHAYDLARRAKRQSRSRRSVADRREDVGRGLEPGIAAREWQCAGGAPRPRARAGRRENSAQSPDRRPCPQCGFRFPPQPR
jgi:hypothetical protein